MIAGLFTMWLCVIITMLLSTTASPATSADAGAGERLFTGARTLANGGPACAICHSIAGLPFPNGGTMGPDLTGAYPKFGSEGIDAMLESLYFPTMVPIFRNRPLTPGEQADLKEFLRTASSRPAPAHTTLALALIALAGCACLSSLIALIWRHRLRPVRARLADSPRAASAAAPPLAAGRGERG